jgi:hypothetical protein
LLGADQLLLLLLRGWNPGFFQLLRRYVDQTSDVQTAALLCGLCHALDVRAQTSWFDTYRDLLDQWGLWEVRARLDVAMAESGLLKKDLNRTLHAHCPHCGASLAPAASRPALQHKAAALTAQRPNLAACPACTRDLPACAVCLGHMFCANPYAPLQAVMDIGQWFAWCTSCEHGGHAGCLDAWFASRVVCPVAGCDCVLCKI